MKTKEMKKFEEYVVNFVASYNTLTFDDLAELTFERAKTKICYQKDIPLDSWDRILCLYLKEYYSILVDVVNLDKLKRSGEYAKLLYDFVNSIMGDVVELTTGLAYDNYEREGISQIVAICNILTIAKNDVDFILNDSYENGGWFGAS